MNFFKNINKVVLSISCLTLMGTVLEMPLYYATETEETSNNVLYEFHFRSIDSSESKTNLYSQLENTELKGSTIPFATVKVISDEKEYLTEANENGDFEIHGITLEDKEEFYIIILDQEGVQIEKTLFLTEKIIFSGEELGTEKNEVEKIEEIKLDEPVIDDSQIVENEEMVEDEPAHSEISLNQETSNVQQRNKVAIMAQKGTRYYYVKSKDTLYSISKNHNVSIENLMSWNNISDASKISQGDVISLNGVNDYNNYNKEKLTFSTEKQFLDYVAPYAKDIATKNNLYASIMIAQASLETGYGNSDLAKKANNFFGVKADSNYSGYSIIMPTQEVVNGQTVTIDAAFRLYPSFYESLLDNANKLRYGLSWSPTYYNGTWIENTNIFKDATLFLTGRYATDPQYYSKLNKIILNNNLTQYDTRGYKDSSYNAMVTAYNYPIGNVPLNHVDKSHAWYGNIQTIGNTSNYIWKNVSVMQVSKDGQFANIYENGIEKGWVKTEALTRIDTGLKNVRFNAYLTSETSDLRTLPEGQSGSAIISKTKNYTNKNLLITNQTTDGLQSYITYNGVGIGWVMTKELGPSQSPLNVVISSGNHSIDSLPWGESGFKKIGSSSSYTGKEYQVVATSFNGAYVLLSENNILLGWIDERAVQNFTYNNVSIDSYITDGQYSIDSLPWGTSGFKNVSKSSNYLGKKIKIVKETSNGSYVQVMIDGKVLGWLDKRATGLTGQAFGAYITLGGYSIDSLPWGTPGFKHIATSKLYKGQLIEVLGATKNGAYLLISMGGKQVGWIDKRAVTKYDSTSVNYTTYITGNNYEINDLPWGEKGYKKLGTTANYLGNIVTVTRESKNKAYAYAYIDGKAIGWIDKRAFGFKNQPYKAIIIDGKYEVNTLPWGTEGYKKITTTSSYIGSEIDIVGGTQNGSYLLAKVNGTTVGWIDSRSVKKIDVNSINYSGTIISGAYSIDSLPWGEPGYKKIGTTATLIGKNIKATLESSNKAYVFIFVDDQPVGWVDKRAIN